MRTLLLALSSFSLVSSIAFAQIEELERSSRAGANAVMAMDVAGIKSTPFAVKNGWSGKLEDAFADRTIFLPPSAKQVLVASHLVFDQGFTPDWQVATMALNHPVSMPVLARLSGGQLDEIRGTQTVLAPDQTYLISFGEQVLGVLTPPNRRAASDWIRQTQDSPSTSPLSSYLSAAIRRLQPETQIVIAVDLKDVASLHEIQNQISTFQSLEKNDLNVEDVARLLHSVHGLAIDISIDTDALVKLRAEFGEEVKLTPAVAKALMLEILSSQGVEIKDLAGHRFQVAGHSIMAEGNLSSAGMKRIISVLELSTPSTEQLASGEGGSSASSGDQMGKASQVYYKSAISLLDDLRGDREKQDRRGGQDAVWMDRYSKKIDRLPILNVDADLLEWGTKTAETLRIMAATRRNAGLEAGAQKSALRMGYYYDSSNTSFGYGNVSGTNAKGDIANRNQIDTQLQNSATSVRVEGWRLIDDATAQIRQEMTKRYQIEF